MLLMLLQRSILVVDEVLLLGRNLLGQLLELLGVVGTLLELVLLIELRGRLLSDPRVCPRPGIPRVGVKLHLRGYKQ